MPDLTHPLLELGARLGDLSSGSDGIRRKDDGALGERLVEAGERHAAACAEADEALLARDRLILEASEAGFSRREVARAAGVSPGRVQQILDRPENGLPR